MFLLASAACAFGTAVAHDVSEACRSFNLTFDATRGVPEPEVRGRILSPTFYESIGIANLSCFRAPPRNSAKSVCRLFDTSVPVGYWNESCVDFGCECDCAPPACDPTICGDPDLVSASEGMVLIIEERSVRRAPAYPPDDNERGGSILVEFSFPTTVLSIGFMDIEEPTPAIMEVCIEGAYEYQELLLCCCIPLTVLHSSHKKFRHANGAVEVVGPVTGNNGHAIEQILIDGVLSFTITFIGSGAISSLQFSQSCTAVSPLLSCRMFLLAWSGSIPSFRHLSIHSKAEVILTLNDFVRLVATLFTASVTW